MWDFGKLVYVISELKLPIFNILLTIGVAVADIEAWLKILLLSVTIGYTLLRAYMLITKKDNG